MQALNPHSRLRPKWFVAGLLLFQFLFLGTSAAEENCESDYPTFAIADYVLACMAANGNTFQSLHQCSCSIDLIKSRISYEDYERIQTIMQVQNDKGQRGIFFRDSHWAKNQIESFQKIQAESTLECF